MIFSVEKRRFRRNRKLRETRSYQLRCRVGDMAVDRWVSPGATNRRVAVKKAPEFIQGKEREATGIVEAKVERNAAKKLLTEPRGDFVADLERRGRSERSGRGARLLKGRKVRLMDACGWKLARQVPADSLTAWRGQSQASAPTLNHYLQATHGHHRQNPEAPVSAPCKTGRRLSRAP